VRVLFNTYPVAFDCPGGGEVQLLRCKQALESLGVEVVLFDPWKPQFGRVDLVHYFSVQGGSMNFCDYVKKIGLPLVISPVLWLTAENRPFFPLREIRDLLHHCDRILPNSQAECDQLAETFDVDLDKFSVVPNGVDPEFGVPADPQAFRRHFGVSFPFLLNVANIEPRKNQLLLAQVARHMELDLLLLGRARDHEFLASCLTAGGPRVRHLGCLDHADPLLKSAYRACEVFVLPSLLETPGLAGLEAAAQGAKLVITRVGSTAEYFQDLVSYVDPDDAQSLQHGIETQRAAQPDQRLRTRVLTNFTWAHAAKALIEAYSRTLLATGSVR
jgi:glycosyltransferase involved in cell wall biosynthesis